MPYRPPGYVPRNLCKTCALLQEEECELPKMGPKRTWCPRTGQRKPKAEFCEGYEKKKGVK